MFRLGWLYRCCTELFQSFSLDCFQGCITHTAGRLVHTIVQGNCLLKVMGQESCQYFPGKNQTLTMVCKCHPRIHRRLLLHCIPRRILHNTAGQHPSSPLKCVETIYRTATFTTAADTAGFVEKVRYAQCIQLSLLSITLPVNLMNPSELSLQNLLMAENKESTFSVFLVLIDINL